MLSIPHEFGIPCYADERVIEDSVREWAAYSNFIPLQEEHSHLLDAEYLISLNDALTEDVKGVEGVSVPGARATSAEALQQREDVAGCEDGLGKLANFQSGF